MSDQIEQGAASLIERLQDSKLEIESTWAALEELYPKLEAEAKAEAAGASLDAVRKCLDLEGSASVEEFLGSASEFFRDLRDRDRSFLAGVNAGIERISALDEIIARVRTDSEEMEIVSLNALTAALKSGSAGRAFSVITDELKKLSFKTISVTEAISAQGRKLLDYFRSLGAVLTELAGIQEIFFEEIRSTLSGGFSALDTIVREAASSFGELSREAEAVRESLIGIAQGEDVRDAVRQSLGQVLPCLREACKDRTVSRRDMLAYLAAAAELSRSPLEELIGRIESGLSGPVGRLDEVANLVERLEQRRKEAASVCEAIEAGSGVAMARTRNYLDLRDRALSAGRSLSEHVKRLNDSFRILASLLGKFQNIVVASRIEIARTRALSVVSNTVAGMMNITELLDRDVGQATELTKSFIKTASAEILSYDKIQERNEERLRLSARRIEDELERLHGSRERVRTAISAFRLHSPEFPEQVRAAQSHLGRLAELKQNVESLLGEVESLGRQAAEGLEGSDEDSRSIRNERLRRTLARFAKIVHGREAAAGPGLESLPGACI